MAEGNPKDTTAYLLGEIAADVKTVKGYQATQNGAIEKLKTSVNGFSEKLNGLPCSVHSEKLTNLLEEAERHAKDLKEEHQGKKRARRELFIALIAALVTGSFTLIGLLLARGGG